MAILEGPGPLGVAAWPRHYDKVDYVAYPVTTQEQNRRSVEHSVAQGGVRYPLHDKGRTPI